MKHFGISCLAGRGHLYPVAAVGRQLQMRGHRVTVFSRRVARAIIGDAGLDFSPIEDETIGLDIEQSRREASQNGPPTIDVMHAHARSFLRNAPKAMSSRKVDALIVDQLDLATGTVAELLGIPFVNICIQPPLYLDDEVSPFIFDWKPSSSPPERSRNRARNNLVRALLSPVLDTVQKQRRLWGLWLKSDLNEFFSDRAMITQLPAILEFERAHNPRIFYTGPFTDDAGRRPVRFPWELVGKKPIVYACMGTVRNHAVHIFRAIATACADINAQLIMSLGGASTLPSDIGFVPENCIVAHYVPQLEILLRAALSITHAGTNTVLESLSRAVPMIALPVTDDQPGMAARIRWKRLGTVVPFRRVSVPRLRDSIRAVLADPLVHANVRQIQPSIQAQTSVGRAVDIIESKLP